MPRQELPLRRRFLLRSALLAPFAPPAFAQTAPAGTDPASAQALPVVASFSILTDLVRQVGGNRVAVRVLVGPDADSHSFQPRPSDAAALRAARLVVRNGLGFEPWLERLSGAAGGQAVQAVASAGVQPRIMEGGHDHDHGGAGRRRAHGVEPSRVADPHAWQDLRNGQVYVRNIAAALRTADPAGAALYDANAQALLARLAALDAWVRQQVATVPEARRRVVTSHDAFGYFGAAYGIAFIAPQGISTDDEPSAAEVAALIRQLRAQGTSAVFIENMTNPALLDRLAREAGVRVRGRLYSDALSAADGPAPTYEAMFRSNLGLLVPAMRGDA
jgi:zinc/manganese transport system substrate-binding protein